MRRRISIGLIGDYDESVPAHQAIPLALQRAAEALQVTLGFGWASSFRRLTGS
jgi:CTP synthase (UTP-ammonia lyase)